MRINQNEDNFIYEMLEELDKGRVKFPGNDLKLVALMEEVGELAKALLDEPAENVRAEAIQVAALAMRIVIDGDTTIEPYRKAKGLNKINE